MAQQALEPAAGGLGRRLFYGPLRVASLRASIDERRCERGASRLRV